MQHKRHPVRAIPAVRNAKREGDNERLDIAWELEESGSCLVWRILRKDDDTILVSC